MSERQKVLDEEVKEHTWHKEIEEIERRQKFAEKLGGEENIKKHHDAGRLTARERIDYLLDEGSFHEVGAFTGSAKYSESGELLDVTPSNIVIGKGKINKQKVYVASDDFTVRGGSSESASPEKMVYAERMALDMRIPLIRLVNSAGGSIKLLEKNQSTKIPGYPQWPLGKMLGTIPVVAAALGSCAGLGALRVVHSHFSVMVKDKSHVFAAGPQVVTPGINEVVTKEELGGSKVHARGSGIVDNEAKDEQDALDQIKRFLSYLPRSSYHMPPLQQSDDNINRCEEDLASIVPSDRRRVYNMRNVLELVFDNGSLFEMSRYYGKSNITMLGRLNGYPVGILANDPYIYAGSMSDESSEKITKFIDMCDTFNLPIINFFDQPGVTVGKMAESRGTIRKATRALLAMHQVSVPWCTVYVRRAFGVAGMAWGPDDGRANVRFAWPSAYWGSIPVEGGVEAAYRRDIENSEDPIARRNELVDYYKKYESPFRTAERFKIDEIIDPRKTRPLLCEWIEDSYELIPEIVGVKCRTMRV
ncbi:acyl-CoA carboxylase subunit beta [Alkalihalobacterium alkalinitrilicum]|uniref:acyl-CoA carboxylase subunit beta n=1 Tax=Alkalihalobacterium alkalinitrilicum TaxID=427920 RepID=UPI00099539AC|nr:carboxyl transferase domain-containing protein [Alkalihalobacterium alkalinitrilicum]